MDICLLETSCRELRNLLAGRPRGAGPASEQHRAPGFHELPDAFAEAGVRLVCVEAFPSSKLWVPFHSLTTDQSSRGGITARLDMVLFTLLHETAHVVRGDLEHGSGPIIGDDERSHTLGDEDETDEPAASWVLPRAMPAFPGRISQDWVNPTARRGCASDRDRRSAAGGGRVALGVPHREGSTQRR